MDLPGVNAQGKTKSELIESLKIGSQEMLETEIAFESDAVLTTISIPDPEWAVNAENFLSLVFESATVLSKTGLYKIAIRFY